VRRYCLWFVHITKVPLFSFPVFKSMWPDSFLYLWCVCVCVCDCWVNGGKKMRWSTKRKKGWRNWPWWWLGGGCGRTIDVVWWWYAPCCSVLWEVDGTGYVTGALVYIGMTSVTTLVSWIFFVFFYFFLVLFKKNLKFFFIFFIKLFILIFFNFI